MYDVCIIGCGMSGMVCAIEAARRDRKVILIDKNDKPGKKIYATGNGRCNITNRDFAKSYEAYYNSVNGDHSSFLGDLFNSVKYKYPDEEVIDFLASIGIYTYENNSYIYPRSMQASAVMWALVDELKRLDVETLFKAQIDEIDIVDTHYELKLPNRQISALKVVLACGGASYPKLGGGVSAYNPARSLGLKCNAIRPSLCGLITKEDTSSIAGVRAKACATLYAYNENDSCYKVDSETGELQITDYGLSGIMIFNLSSKAGALLLEGKRLVISLDFLYDYDYEKVLTDEQLYGLFEGYPGRSFKAVLNTFVNDKLAGYIVDRADNFEEKNCTLEDMSDIPDKKAAFYKNMIYMMHNLEFEITGTKDYDSAQVTAGGVALSEINPKDMSLKRYPGIYAIGEITDIDGICGGYNLTYAIISGIRAGASI